MKKAVMCFIGAMMVLSLAACTPTMEKHKVGEVQNSDMAVPKSTQGPGVVTDKTPDLDAPDLDIISIYTVSEDGSKLEGTMEGVETLDAQALVDLLVEYGVLDEGTKAVSFTAEGTPSSEEVGPGIVKIPGFEIENDTKEYGTLELSQFPEGAQSEMKLQAVANTFIENMKLVYLTVTADGQTLGENMTFEVTGK